MNKKPEPKPAFPHVNPRYDGNWDTRRQIEGMLLRDYFAAKAMPTAMSQELGPGGIYHHFCEPACESISKKAYMMADAMMKAREQHNPE